MTDQRSSSPSPRAFAAAPIASRYFPAAAIEEARQRLTRSIERGEGPALVIGAAGTGKTMLLEVLTEQFRGQRKIVSLPGAQLCSRRALLQMILFQLGLPFRGLDEGELRVSLLSHLRPQDGPSRCFLLLVDEADSLPTRLLEELRVLTNVADNGQPLVGLVLFGSANLEERFAEPVMEVFSQRISTRCYLAAFGREETFQYIRAQVAAVGGQPDELFTAEGLEAMFAATDGVPRLLNQLGDQLLWTANETGYSPLDAQIVQQAWSELQQLPAPWNTTERNTAETAVTAVEFGELSTDDEEHADLFFEEDRDDLPALLPMSVSQAAACQSDETKDIETFDATDQVIEQLEQPGTLDGTSSPDKDSPDKDSPDKDSPDKDPPITSRNPFAESFDSEEVVLDQYMEFEGHLLASAQRVSNRSDTAFAQALKQCETIECGVWNAECGTRENLVIDAPNPSADTIVPVETAEANEVGDLLVIEDEGRPGVTVVPGQKFRQLFSRLGASCEARGAS